MDHVWLIVASLSTVKLGDNVLGSVPPSVRLSVRPSVRPSVNTEKSHYQSEVSVCVSTILRGCGRSAFNVEHTIASNVPHILHLSWIFPVAQYTMSNTFYSVPALTVIKGFLLKESIADCMIHMLWYIGSDESTHMPQ